MWSVSVSGVWLLLLVVMCHLVEGKPRSQIVLEEEANEELIDRIQSVEIKCATNEIKVKIPTPVPHFNGMVYPQGLSKNSSCLKEYDSSGDYIEYALPLRSCNTMTLASTEGEEEYFNTIVLEPHPKLVTGMGKGFHVRCKYKRQHRDNTPTVTMKILKSGKEITHQGNETIQIGDLLQFRIQVHSNQTMAFLVSDCHVRDGLGWAEELLVNHVGCPVDSEILPPFTYTPNMAVVEFPAHKFPYSPTVYYSCAVRICRQGGANEDACLPPLCQGPRNARQVQLKFKRDAANTGEEPATVQVFNGLFVSEPPDTTEADKAAEVLREKKDRGEVLCFSQRDFAIWIAVAGLILMVAVFLVLFILCVRRSRGGKKGGSDVGSSSIYSGSGTNFTGNTRGYGYSNTAYSHSSE
jgi:hypothetical protein